MRNAQNTAPKTCECGKRLPKPHYHKRELNMQTVKWYCKHCDEPVFDYRRDGIGPNVWAIKCKWCQRFYVWSFPHDWIIRSLMPLFDTLHKNITPAP